MSQFDAQWLAMREPADHRARDDGLTRRLLAYLQPYEHISALDLGSGTASNVRYLSPLFGGEQNWRLLDYDADLLDIGTGLLADLPRHRAVTNLSATTREVHCDVPQRHFSADLVDLNQLDELNFTGLDLVTGSALLDLVSEHWLAKLVERCVGVRSAVFFVLNYDGEFALSPKHETDELVRHAINQHQLSDKGFGPALGPQAWRKLQSALEHNGYQVMTAPSIWTLGSDDIALQQALMSGWVSAASEQYSDRKDLIAHWHRERASRASLGQLSITVSHRDLLAIPK